MRKEPGSALWIIAVVAALVVVGCKSGEKPAESAVSVQAAVAQKSDISRVVHTEAGVFPKTQSLITPQINTPGKKFYFVRGQKGPQCPHFARLENTELSPRPLDNQNAHDHTP